MFLSRIVSFLVLATSTGAAMAQIDNGLRVPEPGILELVAVAAVVGYVVRKRGRK